MDTRLKHIAKLASMPSGYTVVDCGCDHGKVLYKLLIDNPDCKAIAIDKSAPSLDKARKLLESFEDRATFFCSDGITCLGDNAYDVLIISGMGGHNIIDILSDGKAKFDKIILSPHTNVDLVRQWLINNNYFISSDSVIQCKKKKYAIIVTHKHSEEICQP